MSGPVRYGDDLLHDVAAIEIGDGRIRRGTADWARRSKSQEARAPSLDPDESWLSPERAGGGAPGRTRAPAQARS
jgi:hypothetical protein